MVACNDYILIESCLFRLLQLNLSKHPSYAQILELFHEVHLVLDALPMHPMGYSHIFLHMHQSHVSVTCQWGLATRVSHLMLARTAQTSRRGRLTCSAAHCQLAGSLRPQARS